MINKQKKFQRPVIMKNNIKFLKYPQSQTEDDNLDPGTDLISIQENETQKKRTTGKLKEAMMIADTIEKKGVGKAKV
jgi:hypothetical protein